METQEVIVQLREIFADFRAARDHIAELERELQQTRQENTTLRKIPIPSPKRINQLKAANDSLQDQNESLRNAVKIKKERIDLDFNAATRIGELESANSTFSTKISSLQDSIKVKKERMELDSKAAGNTILLNSIEIESIRKEMECLQRTLRIKEVFDVDLRAAVKSERDTCAEVEKKYEEERAQAGVLSARCGELEAHVKQSTDAASNAEKSREETLRQFQLLNEGYKNQAEKLSRVNSELATLLHVHRTTSKNLDEARAHNSTLTSRCDALNADLNSLRAAYEFMRAEMSRLQENTFARPTRKKTDQQNQNQKPPETVDLTQDNDPETDASQTAPSCEPENSPVVDGTSASADIPLTLEEQISIHRAHMDALPLHGRQPPISQLRPICNYIQTSNAQTLVENVDPNMYLLANLLFIPSRIVPAMNGNFIAFGPSHIYDSDKREWTQSSDLDGLDGSRRELFFKPERGRSEVFYAGLYKCIDLDKLYPGQRRVSLPPKSDWTNSIRKAALPSIQKKSYQKWLIKQFLPSGRIGVACLGLQRVGFTSALDGAVHRKRGAEGEGGGSPRKRQRRTNDERA